MTEPSTWQRLCPLDRWHDSVLEAVEGELADGETRAELAACEASGSYPRGVIERLRRAGVAHVLAEEHGANDSRVTVYHFTALCALAARSSASLAVTLGINGLALLPAYIAASDDQLRAIFARVHGGSFAAMLLTELAHGSNLLRNDTRAEPGTYANGAFAATTGPATHYRLRGEKNLINGATEHELRFVLARTHDSQGDDALAAANFTILWVDGRDGIEPLPRWKTLPVAAADISGVRFRDVIVPATNAIGREGDGFAIIQKALAISRGGISAFAAGTSCRGCELALDYAATRDIYGEPIVKLGAIADHLIRFEALDLLVAALSVKATALMNAVGPAAVHYTAAAKLACCALAEDGVAEGRRVLGARSLLASLPYESVMRDVLVYGIFDGTSHVMLDQLQRRLVQLATRGESSANWLDTLRGMYATRPRRIVESGRHRGRPVLEPIDGAARALCGIAGSVVLEPVVALAEALLAVVRALRDGGRWEADQGIRFAGGGILAGLEAILAMIELADPERRTALGMTSHAGGPRAARQPLVYRFALGWYASRLCAELRQLALLGDVPVPPPLDAAEAALGRDAATARGSLIAALQA